MADHGFIGVVCAVAATPSAIATRIVAAFVPHAWIGHMGAILTALMVVAWMYVIVGQATRIILGRLEDMQQELAVGNFLDSVANGSRSGEVRGLSRR